MSASPLVVLHQQKQQISDSLDAAHTLQSEIKTQTNALTNIATSIKTYLLPLAAFVDTLLNHINLTIQTAIDTAEADLPLAAAAVIEKESTINEQMDTYRSNQTASINGIYDACASLASHASYVALLDIKDDYYAILSEHASAQAAIELAIANPDNNSSYIATAHTHLDTALSAIDALYAQTIEQFRLEIFGHASQMRGFIDTWAPALNEELATFPEWETDINGKITKVNDSRDLLDDFMELLTPLMAESYAIINNEDHVRDENSAMNMNLSMLENP
jgi:hypothetical protein